MSPAIDQRLVEAAAALLADLERSRLHLFAPLLAPRIFRDAECNVIELLAR